MTAALSPLCCKRRIWSQPSQRACCDSVQPRMRHHGARSMDLARSRDHVSHGSHGDPGHLPDRVLIDVRNAGPVTVHPGRVTHWCGSHGKLEPVRHDTSRSPPYRLPTALLPGPAAGTNLVRTGIRTASAYRSEAHQREDHMARPSSALRRQPGRPDPAGGLRRLPMDPAGIPRLSSAAKSGDPLRLPTQPRQPSAHGEFSTHRLRVTTLHKTMEDS